MEVSISNGNQVTGKLRNSPVVLRTTLPSNYPDVYKLLQDHKVNIDVKEASSNNLITLLVNASPFLILIAFWIFMMRQMQTGGNKALSFGKSRARLLSTQQKKVTFKDVAGVEEAKEELQEIIEFLREPQKFQKLGGRIPKGVLLVGSPGTGKTLLARAIAGEANVPFFSISGSDFVEMFVGVGVLPEHVPGPHPLAEHGRPGALEPVPVVRRERLALDQELADHARGHRAPGVVDQARLEARHDLSR